MYRRRRVDRVLLFSTMLLLVIGLFVLASASFTVSELRFGTPYFYFRHQLIYGVLTGLLLMFFAARIHYRTWRRFALPLVILSLGLLLMVFLPNIGIEYGGARRWISVGSFSFQPSEILKFTFVVYLAAWLDIRKKEVASLALGLAPFLFMVSFVGFFFLLEPNIGTLGVVSITSLFLFFLGGGRVLQIFLLTSIGFIFIASLVFFQQYSAARIFTFLNPDADPQGAGYQIRQSLIAIGSGGIVGRGFGLSRQKFQYLPEPMGDGIFAIFAEELGFMGSIVLFGLFLVFLWRGMMIAMRAPDRFSQLLVSGIVSMIFVQIIINVGAFSGVIPLTGISLPFISYGGSNLSMLLGEVGVLLNVSRYI